MIQVSRGSNEPKSAAAVKRWIEKHTRSSDRFAYVADKYEPHRKEHGCYDVYSFENRPLLGALAAAAKSKRLPIAAIGEPFGIFSIFGNV